MIVDAQVRLTSVSELADLTLKRSDITGTPLLPQVFALIDAIYMGDARLGEMRSWQQQ